MAVDRSKWHDPLEDPPEPLAQDDPAFVIACVGWHTQRPGNEGLEWLENQTRLLYSILIRFLQDNGLTTQEILADGAPVTDRVAIRVGDLTKEGYRFMQEGYSRWLRRIDQGMDPTNTSILERALKKIREDKGR